MLLNQHVREAIDKGNVDNFNLDFDFGDFTPQDQPGGWVPDGRYQLYVRKARGKKHPTKEGESFVELYCVVRGPEQFDGESIKISFPVAAKHSEDDDVAGKVRRMNSVIYSILSEDPETVEAKLAEFKAASQANQKVTLNVTVFETKTLYCSTTTDISTKGNKYTQAQYYITREEYEARPGPIASLVNLTVTAQPAAGPELMGGTTTVETAAATVADLAGVPNNGTQTQTPGFTI